MQPFVLPSSGHGDKEEKALGSNWEPDGQVGASEVTQSNSFKRNGRTSSDWLIACKTLH